MSDHMLIPIRKELVARMKDWAAYRSSLCRREEDLSKPRVPPRDWENSDEEGTDLLWEVLEILKAHT